MADKWMTGSPDRDRINLSEDYEIRDWTQSLGVREQEGAVKRVSRRLTIGDVGTLRRIADFSDIYLHRTPD